MVGPGYFYILAIKGYKEWLKIVVKPIENDKFFMFGEIRKQYHDIENGIII